MAFAIASGVKPEQGIFTAIIAGFLISALGGSQVQIGGPAGAFIVIVYGIVQRYGLPNLLIATALAGVLLFVMGWFKLGALVRYIPVSIVIGFTNGIAVLIALSQLKDLLGLAIGNAAGRLLRAGRRRWRAHIGSFNPYAFALGAAVPGRPRSCGRGCSQPGRLLPARPARAQRRCASRRGCRARSSRWSRCRCWRRWLRAAGRDHRQRFGGIPQRAAGARAARLQLGRRVKQLVDPDDHDRAARRDRVAAVRARRRQPERPARATTRTRS